MFWQKQDNCPHRWFTCLRELESNLLCSHALVNTKWNLGVDQTRKINFIYLEIESVRTKIYLCQCISTCVCIKIFMRQIFLFLQYYFTKKFKLKGDWTLYQLSPFIYTFLFTTHSPCTWQLNCPRQYMYYMQSCFC